MEKLDKKVKINGTGIPGLTAVLVERDGRACTYQRSDGVFEVFIVQVCKEGEVFGKLMPTREVYPCNEDFGNTAWTYREIENARKRHARIKHVN